MIKITKGFILALVIGFFSSLIPTTIASAANLLSPGTIVTCGEITTSGDYTVGADLSSPAGVNCLNIHDVSNVNLICNNHFITSPGATGLSTSSIVVISSVTGFTVTGCKMVATNNTETAQGQAIYIQNSKNGRLTGNVID